MSPLLPYCLVGLVVVLVPGLAIGAVARQRGWRLFSLAPWISVSVIACAAIVADWVGLAWGWLPVVALAIIAGGAVWLICRFAVAGGRPKAVGRRQATGQGGGISGAEGDRMAATSGASSAGRPSAFDGGIAHSDGRVDITPSSPSRHRRNPWLWGAWLITATFGTVEWLRLIGPADSISQTYDAIFHLSALRWIIDSGNGSSLTFSAGLVSDQSFFYPAAFHDLTTLIAQLLGSTNVVYACNACVWLMMAVIWPLGIFALIDALLPALSRTGLLAAAIIISGSAGLPLLMLSWGVLYPNCLAFILLPAGLALVARLLGLNAGSAILGDRAVFNAANPKASLDGTAVDPTVSPLSTAIIFKAPTPPAHSLGITTTDGPIGSNDTAAAQVLARSGTLVDGLFLVIGLPGLFLAHPSGLLALIAISSPLLLVWAWRGLWRNWVGRQIIDRRRLWISGSLLIAFVIIWLFARTGEARPPINSWEASVGEFLLAAPGQLQPAWLLGALIITGLYWLVRRRQYHFLLGPVMVLLILWLAASAMPAGDWRDLLTIGFYDDAIRLGALSTVILLPVAVIGVEASLERLRQTLARRGITSWQAAIDLAVLLVLFIGIAMSSALNAAIEQGRWSYAIAADSPLLDSDEYALIMQLDEQIPTTAVVAVDPWNGSSLAYPLAGVPTSSHMVDFASEADQAINADQGLIQFRLRYAASDPAVCAALDRTGVSYALSFGYREVHEGQHPAPGFDQLSSAEGFVEVDRVGQAALYRIDAC
ncbi:MAG: hypothetical protein LBV30_08580 [Propionibacteriaceae bacterium]|jgi:hypothetical protein|nr:hypothetical protein [Propionibacteriaceae bacterium]